MGVSGSFGILGRGDYIRELSSIDPSRGSIDDKCYPTRPSSPWIPPCMICAPLDDGVARIHEMGLSTVWKDQHDLSGHCNNIGQKFGPCL